MKNRGEMWQKSAIIDYAFGGMGLSSELIGEAFNAAYNYDLYDERELNEKARDFFGGVLHNARALNAEVHNYYGRHWLKRRAKLRKGGFVVPSIKGWARI